MLSRKRKRRVMAFEMMLFGAAPPETICDSTYGPGPFRKSGPIPCVPPIDLEKDIITGYMEVDTETGALTISEGGYTKTWYPDGRTESKKELPKLL